MPLTPEEREELQVMFSDLLKPVQESVTGLETKIGDVTKNTAKELKKVTEHTAGEFAKIREDTADMFKSYTPPPTPPEPPTPPKKKTVDDYYKMKYGGNK